MGTEVARNLRRVAKAVLALAVVLIVVYIVKAGNLPDASTCQAILNVDPTTACTSSAPAGLAWGAGVCAVIGVLLLAIVPRGGNRTRA
jgi:hypothetical protein